MYDLTRTRHSRDPFPGTGSHASLFARRQGKRPALVVDGRPGGSTALDAVAQWAAAQGGCLGCHLGNHGWRDSCGYIIDLLSTLKDAGLNVIQQDQQENMGLENLDAKVGGRLAFWCPVDIQKTMVQGTVADVRAYVRRMIATLGSHNGGLVSMAYSTPEAVQHTPEKIAAMCAAFREYGRYGE